MADHSRRIKDRFFPGWQQRPWPETEIKGRYLAAAARRAEKGLQPMDPAAYRTLQPPNVEQLVDSVFNTLHKFTPRYYFVGVDKGRLLATHPRNPLSPLGIAYAYLQMRAALLVEDVYGKGEGALFVADEERSHERQFRKGEIRQVREALARRVERLPNMELLLDKPLWINKGELPADREIAQMADVGLYIVGTALSARNWQHPWLQRLSPYLARHWTRGGIWGAGITIYPHPTSYPRLPS